MPKKKDLAQREAFNFLLEKFKSHASFTKEEFQKATGWSKAATFDTYWSKQYKTLVVPLKGDRYRISEVFTRFNTWAKFRTHVTQNRQVSADYKPSVYKSVVLFEFFMPLTNEGYLRTSLDALFYKNSIIARLKSTDITELRSVFPAQPDEAREAYYERLCEWISANFGGYSISHVSGRFRADELKSAQDALKADRYFVDETTAVVRFIFPCREIKIEVTQQADRIRFFFFLLFVQNIVEIVNGEDEIWLLESGLQSRLHIWRVQED